MYLKVRHPYGTVRYRTGRYRGLCVVASGALYVKVRYRICGHTLSAATLCSNQFGTGLTCLQGGDGILVNFFAIFLSCQFFIKSCDKIYDDRSPCFIAGSLVVKSCVSEVILCAERRMLPLSQRRVLIMNASRFLLYSGFNFEFGSYY